MSLTVLAILYALHLLAAVVWIGGLMLLALVVIPGARRALSNSSNGVEALVVELERRFTPLANLSMVVLVATGLLQMSADVNYDGFLQLSNTWAWAMLLKHVAVVGMALSAGYVALVLEPERSRLEILAFAKRPNDMASNSLADRRARLAKLNLFCGLLTLLFTAVATAQ